METNKKWISDSIRFRKYLY